MMIGNPAHTKSVMIAHAGTALTRDGLGSSEMSTLTVLCVSDAQNLAIRPASPFDSRIPPGSDGRALNQYHHGRRNTKEHQNAH